MPVYYVTHPNLTVSAAVEAPATEKARTTFLDYLERTGSISRESRHRWRKNMVAERMEDPQEIYADVQLRYGYGGPTTETSILQPTTEPEPGEVYEPEDVDYSEPVGDGTPFEESSVSEGHRTIRDVSVEAPKKLSPIQKLALGKAAGE